MDSNKKQKYHRLEIFFEFLVFGIFVGIGEDLLVVYLATGENITLRILLIAVGVTIPFAILGELIVDKINFEKIFEKILKKK